MPAQGGLRLTKPGGLFPARNACLWPPLLRGEREKNSRSPRNRGFP